MFTVSSTLTWAVLTGPIDWVCHIGTLTMCVEAVAQSCIIVTWWIGSGGIQAWSRRPTDFLQCFDTVGLVIWPVKIVPKMTYNVLSGTLSLYTTTSLINVVRFDLGWPWRVKMEGHTFWREICKERQELRCWTQRRLYRVPIGFTLDELKRLKVKVTIFWFEMNWKWWQIRGWTPGSTYMYHPRAFDWHRHVWPWMTLRGQH